jgi:16S rRNA (guanine527-N7)-methyltransferase
MDQTSQNRPRLTGIMENFARSAKTLFGVSLSPAQVEMFRRYSEALTAWNAHTNLTAITEPEAIEHRHFLDSLSCLTVIKPRRPGLRMIDVGTGAGFPGLPLKIAVPDIDLTLVEATGKKIDFLHHILDTLGLKGVTLINERAEAVGQMSEHRESYDWVLARAVAGMRTLAEYLLPLAQVGGHVLAQKGENAPHEVSEAQEVIHLLGGRINQLTAIELPTVADTRYLIDIEKIARTSPAYPRRVGVPSKKPL